MAQSSRQQQKDATAQRLFEAAVHLFLTRGYHETTVAAITAAAGVAKGTFFVHFSSKDAVLEHLGTLQVLRLRAALAENSDVMERSFAEQVRFIYHTLGAGIEQQRDMVLLIAVEGLRRQGEFDRDTQSMQVFEDMLLPLATSAWERGELRREVQPAAAAALLRGLYFMAVFDWLRSDGIAFQTIADQHLTLVFTGLLNSR